MSWTDEQRDSIVQGAMDLASGVDRFRVVVIMTMDNAGTFSTIRKRTKDTSGMELLGMLRVLEVDEERTQMEGWTAVDRPLAQGDDSE